MQQDFKQKRFPMTTANCPTCKKVPMKLVTTSQKKRFLACSDENCKTYLSVPKTGRISILKSSFCSICGFNTFKIVKRKNGKSIPYYICPKCWSASFKDDSVNGFCSNCKTHKILNEKCVER